jgi:hypothetical protein
MTISGSIFADFAVNASKTESWKKGVCVQDVKNCLPLWHQTPFALQHGKNKRG